MDTGEEGKEDGKGKGREGTEREGHGTGKGQQRKEKGEGTQRVREGKRKGEQGRGTRVVHYFHSITFQYNQALHLYCDVPFSISYCGLPCHPATVTWRRIKVNKKESKMEMATIVK